MAQRSSETIDYYSRKLGHVVRLFDNGKAKLAEVTQEAMLQYIEVRLKGAEDAAPVSPQTVKKELAAFKSVLTSARHRGDFDRDPSMVMPRRFKAPYIPRKRYLPREKLPAFLAELPPHRAAWVSLAIATGARHSEVERLEKRDIRFSKMEVFIDGRKNGGALRTIPILEQSAPLLRYALEAGCGEEGKVVIPWARSNQCRQMTDAVRAVGGGDRLSANDLRRTLASWLIQDGVPPNLIAFLLGHKSSQMVERVYGRMTPSAAGALIAGILGRKPAELPCTDSVPSPQIIDVTTEPSDTESREK